MYDKAQSVPMDLWAAAYWYEKAAELGVLEAAVNLGALYFNGRGVPRDLEKTKHWYQFAAERGDPMALSNLGQMYANGDGFEKNLNVALKLYFLSQASGGSGVEGVIENLVASLPADVVERAREQASECQKRNYQGCIIE